jgi:hypothetical protein
MRCKECNREMFWDGYEFSTMLGYSSSGGHDHNDNCLIRIYKCFNGHVLKESLRRVCPVCDWKGKEECFCHSGKKVDRWSEVSKREEISDAGEIQEAEGSDGDSGASSGEVIRQE